MSFNSLLNRIWRAIAVFAMLVSLLLGDILLFPSVALAKPGFLPQLGTVDNLLPEWEELDRFDRDGDPANVGQEFRPDIPLETCFWVSTIGSSSYHNAFFPDQQAFYPGAVFSLEEGSYVKIKGEFPHARTMSFSAYRYDPTIDTKVGSVQQILDRDIVPDLWSKNPFVEGGKRMVKNRSYTLKFVPEEEPKELEPNTLYLGTQEFPGTGFIVVMRLYVGDQGTNTLGDITLPEATIVKEDGSEITGNDICSETKFSGNLIFPSPAFNFDDYQRERDNRERETTRC
ncbi:MAG: hypothetical protein F6K26_08920 [Moorea sp. SIO2I5]|nr:hypothetical protein [Moorena sp. SIO2I5]